MAIKIEVNYGEETAKIVNKVLKIVLKLIQICICFQISSNVHVKMWC